MIARLTAGAGLLALALASTPALADDKPWTLEEALGNPEGLEISASVRARYEALHNQFRPGLDRNDELITFQTDIAAEYDGGPIRIGGELIDSRAYDGKRGGAVGTGEVNALEPVQLYVGADLGSVLGEGSETKIDAGRFTLNLGSRRLVGRNTFRNTTNAFTGVKAEWRYHDQSQLTLFYTYPQQRLPDDKTGILDNQVVHFKLAEMQTEVELLRSLTYRAAEALIAGEDVTRLATMAKLKAGRLGRELTDACLQYWGGMGFMNETPVSRAYRDTRLTSIGGGADEVMLMVLCKMMGTLPGMAQK